MVERDLRPWTKGVRAPCFVIASCASSQGAALRAMAGKKQLWARHCAPCELGEDENFPLGVLPNPLRLRPAPNTYEAFNVRGPRVANTGMARHGRQ
jgi:hypothetical protein